MWWSHYKTYSHSLKQSKRFYLTCTNTEELIFTIIVKVLNRFWWTWFAGELHCLRAPILILFILFFLCLLFISFFFQLTNREMFQNLEFVAVSGPTYDQQPPFDWRKADFSKDCPHNGHPDVFQFNPVIFNSTSNVQPFHR